MPPHLLVEFSAAVELAGGVSFAFFIYVVLFCWFLLSFCVAFLLSFCVAFFLPSVLPSFPFLSFPFLSVFLSFLSFLPFFLSSCLAFLLYVFFFA